MVRESSLVLLARAQEGDSAALEELIGRYLPRLQRWASGRLPASARDLADTQDLVQETVIASFRRLNRFEIRGEGALLAYFRQALINRIRQEIRRAGRRPPSAELDSQTIDGSASPLELAIGREAVHQYELALQRLRPQDRQAIIGRIELGLSNDELAATLGKPSANAARMAVERALFRLATEMATQEKE